MTDTTWPRTSIADQPRYDCRDAYVEDAGRAGRTTTTASSAWSTTRSAPASSTRSRRRSPTG